MRLLFLSLVFTILVSGCEYKSKTEGELGDGNLKNDGLKTVVWNEMSYDYALFSVSADKLSLVLNLPEKRKTREVMRKKECDLLINGGFYGKDDKPLGLLMADGEVYSQKIASALLNGFVSVEKNGVAVIGTKMANDPVLAVQSGPVLIAEGKLMPLEIKNDAARRRMIAAVTDDQKLVFGVVVEPGSKLTGPRLEDLPQVVEKIGQESGYEFIDAINLDGGSASSYYDGNVYVEEANPVGSYFCFKERLPTASPTPSEATPR